MRKKIFTVMAALCSLVVVNAADVTTYAELKAALGGGDATIRVKVGTYTIPVGDGQLVIPSTKTVIGGYTDFTGEGKRIYPGAAIDKTEMTVLDGNSLVNTAPGDKHRVATVEGTLEGCMIRNGHVRGNGGGVLVDGGTVLNCIIKGNVAMDADPSSPSFNDAKGGGAYVQNAGKLINCVVAFNMANNGYGIAGTGTVVNNTITANTYAPTAVLITGGTYQHFKHWQDPAALPWTTFNSTTDLDATSITVNTFSIAETETTTSQYAVFAAAMDLEIRMNLTSQEVFFSDGTFALSSLTDPSNSQNVGTYMGFTSQSGDFLFQAAARTDGYGLIQEGQDFIYYSTRANEAMTYVTWYGALAYSLWLGGTLPTEGQWEYAARYNGSGLDNTMYAGADDINTVGNIAWYGNNSGNRVKEVATRNVTGVGLFDMTGNTWEWCADFLNISDAVNGSYPTYSSTTDPICNVKTTNLGRIRRGGSLNALSGELSLAYRSHYGEAGSNRNLGFRPVFK